MTSHSQREIQQTQTWRQIRQMVEMPARVRVKALVDQHADLLSDLFYKEMLAGPDMGRFLDHEAVNRRLHASMARWLKSLFDEATPVEELVAAQRKTGEVHARIGVAHTAVAAGARVLKRALARKLLASPDPAVTNAGAVQYVYELVDIAMDAMGDSTNVNANRLSRSDESYRLFFLTQNLRAERERQKSQLLEWAQQILVLNYWDVPQDDVDGGPPPRRISQFELWIEHKASMLFENAPELALIRQAIATTERSLLPRLKLARAHHASAKDVVAELHVELEHMKTLLGTMFDRAAEMEDGRDDVTRLLNRRYFPSIVKREIGLAQGGGNPFALLVLDIDGFTDIAHALGPEVTDMVLAQVADTLSENVRAGDFVFRVGDEQFLVLLVEAGNGAAMAVADGLRQQIGRMTLRTPAGMAPHLSISTGVALFDGHPDYQRLLERAEQALRRAKAGGPNRIEQAEALA